MKREHAVYGFFATWCICTTACFVQGWHITGVILLVVLLFMVAYDG